MTKRFTFAFFIKNSAHKNRGIVKRGAESAGEKEEGGVTTCPHLLHNLAPPSSSSSHCTTFDPGPILDAAGHRNDEGSRAVNNVNDVSFALQAVAGATPPAGVSRHHAPDTVKSSTGEAFRM